MLQDFSIAVFSHNSRLCRRLADSVKGMGVPLEQFSYSDRLDSVERWAQGANLIALFDATQQPKICLRSIQWLCEDRPNTVSVWIQQEFKRDDVADAMRAGARDLLVGEFSAEDVRSLLGRAANLFAEHKNPSIVFAVSGAAGGCGVSTLVANLAVEIAKLQSAPVGVLDLDPCVSGAGLLLNLTSEHTLFDLWERGEDLDKSMVERIAAKHPAGVSLIMSQGWPLDYLPLREDVVRRVLLAMQQAFPYVLVDLPRGLSPAAQVVLEASDATLLVSQCSMSAAAGAGQTLQALESLRYPPQRILWVANSVSHPAGLSLRQLRHVISRKPIAKIPFSAGPVNEAAEEGKCLADVAGRAPIAATVRGLARTLCQSFGQVNANAVENRARFPERVPPKPVVRTVGAV